MKRLGILALLLPAALLLATCTAPPPAPTQTAAPAPTVAPTDTALPPATTAPVTPGSAQVLDGPPISYNGIHFTLDPALGARLYAYDDAITLNGLTAHSTRFALSPEDYCRTWCVQVYPVAEFEQVFGNFVFPPAGYRGGAAIIFTAQEKPLSFNNGSGSRALEAFGQNHYGVSNESLKYAFRGYTTDQRFAVFVQAPVHAPGLADIAPTLAPGSDPLTGIRDYNTRAAASLNALSPADFTPDLGLLDGLVGSIQVEAK